MISDKQGREWLLQKLYDDGWRYCVMDNFNDLYLTNEKPSMYDDVDEIRVGSCKKAMSASAFKNILPELKPNECISIAEELGIVDWVEVPVDTPILVWDIVGKKKLKRYFAFFENGRVHAWDGGATSWSIDNECCENGWNYAELAEV